MHPFIEQLVKTAFVPISIFEEYLSKDNLVESSILYLKSNLNTFNSKEKINNELIEKALLIGHEDANIFTCFISYAIALFIEKAQLENAKKFISIGENIILSKLHPYIYAFFLQTSSRVKAFNGEINEEKKLLEESLRLINPESPKYEALFCNFALMLARNGMLNDLDEKGKSALKAFIESKENDSNNYAEIQICNSIRQGNYVKILEYLKKFEQHSSFKKNEKYDSFVLALNILSPKRDLSVFETESGKEFVGIFYNFYDNKLELVAEKLNKIYELNPLSYIGLVVYYFQLNYELSLRNLGKAKYILYENKKIGKVHFFDDFFYARVALLDNKREEAAFYFKRLMVNVKKYEFEPRLAFELRFAKELSPNDLFFLIQSEKENSEIVSTYDPTTITPIEEEKKGLELIIGKSILINKSKELIKKYALIHEPVLVTGETGTGKELVAKALHDLGAFANEPFLAINCGALNDALLQSELFGYVAGAFTGAQKAKKGIFESAGNGTVFLDEFEDVSPKMQSSLLRVLESNEIRLIGGVDTKKISCKIVIATNVSLKILVNKKTFREDLYFRLARFEIKLPALKERREDIPELINHFILNNEPSGFTPIVEKELIDKLKEYSWPGNIRELRNAIDKMKILHSDKKSFGINEFDFEQLEDFVVPKSITPDKPAKTLKPSNSLIAPTEKERIEYIMNRKGKKETHHQFLKELFVEYKKMTRAQAIEILKLSPFITTNVLNDLCSEGFIIKRTPTKSTKSHFYELKE